MDVRTTNLIIAHQLLRKAQAFFNDYDAGFRDGLGSFIEVLESEIELSKLASESVTDSDASGEATKKQDDSR